MSQSENNYRDHIIYTHSSGPTGGPWVASFSVWKTGPNNSYRAVLQGSLPGTFPSMDEAHAAANVESRARLDAVLDK